MSNIHTLKDIEDKEVVRDLLGKEIPSGHQLDNIHKSELEKALHGSIKTASNITCYVFLSYLLRLKL